MPLEALHLGAIRSGPLAEEAHGLLFAELQLHDGDGRLLAERLHIFGSADAPAPLAGLVSGAAPGPARTTLEARIRSAQRQDQRESLQIELTNKGDMTALFCEPHPLLAYRQDLDIENNHAFIPPGETRLITIGAPVASGSGLSLAQTGWRISCWNADAIVIEPSEDVLFSIGRRDAMCREFAGYDDLSRIQDIADFEIEGSRPDPAALPLLLRRNQRLRFVFDVPPGAAGPARLRLHTADQSRKNAPLLEATLNGRRFETTLEKGLGIQDRDPAHLAFPQTAAIDLPGGALLGGKNTLEVRLLNDGWLTWDAIDLIKTGG